MNTGIFQKAYIVGLDIGSSSIKLAQFIKREDGLNLIRAALKEIEGATEDKIIDSLKDLLKGINIKKSKFFVTINCPKTCVRMVVAPYMPKGELREGIRLAAKGFFPFPIDEASLDYEILGDVVEKGVKKHKLLVATSPKDTVNKCISLLKRVGIKPSSFIPIIPALKTVIENARPKEEEMKAIFDIGGHLADLAIFQGENLVFCRKIPVAGNDFTKAMTGVLVSDKGRTSLSSEEAERIKREVGIPQEGQVRMINEKISSAQILSMLRPAMEHLASEIERCLYYYREETGGGRIDSLVLFGGGASLKGLPEFLSRELGMEVKLGNPLENIDVEPDAVKFQEDNISNRLAPAIGTALRFGKGVNLLPPEIKEEAKRAVRRASVLGVGTAVILILILIYIGMKIQLVNYQKRIDVALLEHSSLQHQLKLAETQNLANEALASEPYWGDIFKELSNIVPKDIYLTSLSMENRIIRMKGLVVSKEKEELLSDFIFALEEGIFKNVKLITTKEVKEMTNEFELRCWVD